MSLIRFLRQCVWPVALGCASWACRESASDLDGSGASQAASSQASTTGGGPARPVRVVNWNIENFYNDKNDSAAAQEQVQSAAQYQAQLTAAAAVLAGIDADIAVLQEVENLAVLEDLDQKLGRKYPTKVLIDSTDPRGIDVAVLAKLPATKTVTHQDDVFMVEGTAGPTYTFARDCLETHFEVAGRKLVMLGVHFRSKAMDDPNKRIAEAQRCRAIANGLAAEDANMGILILGDFNDVPGSNPYKVVQGSPPDEWLDAASVLVAQEQWTFNFNGTKELIDHQFANPILRAMLVSSSVKIVRSAEVTQASDHAPLVATYEVN